MHGGMDVWKLGCTDALDQLVANLAKFGSAVSCIVMRILRSDQSAIIMSKEENGFRKANWQKQRLYFQSCVFDRKLLLKCVSRCL